MEDNRTETAGLSFHEDGELRSLLFDLNHQRHVSLTTHLNKRLNSSLADIKQGCLKIISEIQRSATSDKETT